MKNDPASIMRSTKEDSEQIPELLPSQLTNDDAIRIVRLARVPEEERKVFLQSVYGVMAQVCVMDRLALGSAPGSALKGAAEKARGLHKAIGKLDPIDRQWVEHLWYRSYQYQRWLRDVPKTVFQLAHLLSIAARLSPPREPGVAAPDHQKTDRDRTNENVTFLFLARWLKLLAREFGGKLGNGRLLDVVGILKPYLPEGVVPEKPARTLKRGPSCVSMPDIDIWSTTLPRSHGCQSAFKFDPRSASNFDPFWRRGLAVALAPSELAGVAETARARIVG